MSLLIALVQLLPCHLSTRSREKLQHVEMNTVEMTMRNLILMGPPLESGLSLVCIFDHSSDIIFR